MRLLNTTTLRVEQAKGEVVANEKLPFKYAILSHTWGEDEVIFQDMQAEVPKDSPRFSKIVKSCELAKEDGYEYIWIDTCCIDKSSSAELSEAINSMYLWYNQAAICYAYLSDVEPLESEDPRLVSSSFRKSRWFTRGWTLQELIAPEYMVFFSKDWSKLGDKFDFCQLLSDVTSIDEVVLLAANGLSHAYISIARKMSWAAKRTTTRVEDRAYSLLGIFEVNMPLLYGEGWKAFTRLQEEILKKTDDESLFANHSPEASIDERPLSLSGSLLAKTPDYFLNSEDVLLHNKDWRLHDRTEQGMEALSLVTNKGLLLGSFGCSCKFEPPSYAALPIDGWLMILDCRMRGDIFARPAVFLKPLALGRDRYTRFLPSTLLLVRQTNGNATLENWPDKSSVGDRSEDKPGRRNRVNGYYFYERLHSSCFFPEFNKLHRRTIYVADEGYKVLSTKSNTRVWLRTIVQPEELHIKVADISGGWNVGEQCIYGDGEGVHKQLLFGNWKLGVIFKLVVDLRDMSDYEYEVRSHGSKPQLQYRTWCKLIQLPFLMELKAIRATSMFPDFEFYMDEINLNSFLNKQYATTLVIPDRFTVQATLGLEDFLGRKEFVLNINIRDGSDKEVERQEEQIREET